MFTQEEIRVLGGAVMGFIFLIGLMLQNPKDGTISNKYKRIDYIGSTIFLGSILIIEIIYKIYDATLHVPRGGLLTISLMGIMFLFSGFINLKFKKEINDDTSYKFGLSFFICGWISVVYIISQIL